MYHAIGIKRVSQVLPIRVEARLPPTTLAANFSVLCISVIPRDRWSRMTWDLVKRLVVDILRTCAHASMSKLNQMLLIC